MKIYFFLLFAAVCTAVFAQSSNRFTITRSAMAGGGTMFSASSRFQLASTVGQPVTVVSGSARFSIQGGFWIWPSPILFAPAKIGNNFIVSIQSELGKTYIVQYTDSLMPSDWHNLPDIVGNGAVETVTNAAPAVTQRYYRLIEQ